MQPLLNTQYWTTETYDGIYFNDFIFHALKHGILKRVINNNMSGSSWYIKRFVYLAVKALDGEVEVSVNQLTDFINFEAEAEVVEVEDGKEDDEVSNISEDSFIDDQKVGADVNFDRQFVNVENDRDHVLTEAHSEGLEDIEQFDEISNLCDGSDSEIRIDEFQSSETDIAKFKEPLFPRVDKHKKKLKISFVKQHFMP